MTKSQKKTNKKVPHKKTNRLHKTLEEHYEGYRYKKNNATGNNEYHRLFNKKLRLFLIECNNKKFIPSKSFVEAEILKIKENSKYEIMMKGIDLDLYDFKRIDGNFESMDFHSYIDRKEKSPHLISDMRLRVLGLVPSFKLTPKDHEMILDIFGSFTENKEEEGVILIDLMNVKLSSVVGEDEKDRICDMLLRKCRKKIKSHALSLGENTDFKYSFKHKIKDIITNASI